MQQVGQVPRSIYEFQSLSERASERRLRAAMRYISPTDTKIRFESVTGRCNVSTKVELDATLLCALVYALVSSEGVTRLKQRNNHDGGSK